MQAGALHLLHALRVALVLVRRDDGLHLARRDGEGGRRGPHAVALAVEDCRAVEVAGADEAGGGEGVLVGGDDGGGEEGWYLVSM